MTLKEKLQTKVSINTDGEASRHSKQCEQIADDFAIGFKDWCMKISLGSGLENKSTSELLEIYKKESGL